jgi:hypothetical protein
MSQYLAIHPVMLIKELIVPDDVALGLTASASSLEIEVYKKVAENFNESLNNTLLLSTELTLNQYFSQSSKCGLYDPSEILCFCCDPAEKNVQKITSVFEIFRQKIFNKSGTNLESMGIEMSFAQRRIQTLNLIKKIRTEALERIKKVDETREEIILNLEEMLRDLFSKGNE